MVGVVVGGRLDDGVDAGSDGEVFGFKVEDAGGDKVSIESGSHIVVGVG